MDTKGLEEKLKVKFKDKSLLQQALTHRSYLNESKQPTESNERLEFLGDTVLSFIISDWLYYLFPDSPEGSLTTLRSNLVKTYSLEQIARKLDLGTYLLLSKGERESGGEKNPSLLANSVEAIIAAIFLDQGLLSVKKFIKIFFSPLLKNLVLSGRLKDFKSLLQEKLQARGLPSPIYKTIKEEGPDHRKIFTVGVYQGGELLATGRGLNKQDAQQQAAKLALVKYEKIT